MSRKYTKHQYKEDQFKILFIFFGVGLVILYAMSLLNLDINSTLFITITFTIIAAILGTSILLLIRIIDKRRLRAIAIANVDKMKGEEFERYAGELMKHKGYHVEYTRASGDFGTDIVARKDGFKYSIQIKRWNHSVDRTAISDAVAAMYHYQCNKSMVITNNYFTPQAQEFAKSTQTILVDRETLINWILDFQGYNPEIELKSTHADFAYKVAEKHNTNL